MKKVLLFTFIILTFLACKDEGEDHQSSKKNNKVETDAEILVDSYSFTCSTGICPNALSVIKSKEYSCGAVLISEDEVLLAPNCLAQCKDSLVYFSDQSISKCNIIYDS